MTTIENSSIGRVERHPSREILFRMATAASRRRGRWLGFLCLVLLGYSLFGKGWAYVGVPPLFIGDVTLLSGMAVLAVSGGWGGVLGVLPARFLVLLMAWGSVCTLPYLSRYGVDALRDAAFWGYSLFALVVFGFLRAEPQRLGVLIGRFRWFGRFFPVAAPIALLSGMLLGESMPRLPWADVPIIHLKGGDNLVHAAGILASWVGGLAGTINPFHIMLLAGSLALGAINRGGLISFMAAFTLCLIHRPHDRVLRSMIVMGVIGVMLLAITGFRVTIPDAQREISFEQIASNVTSLMSQSNTGDLEGTKQWRLDWWGKIISYTFHGDYFWTGKGFGVNLADDDGFQVLADGSLRSPHNGHLTMLARAGVPGFVLWVVVQLSWMCGVVRGYVRSRLKGQGRWSGLFLVLLAYWTAFMINATFDVFLEGPMGGIWFWTVYGVGLSAMWLYDHCPEVLPQDGADAGGRNPDGARPSPTSPAGSWRRIRGGRPARRSGVAGEG